MRSYRSQLINLYAQHDVQAIDQPKMETATGTSFMTLLQSPLFRSENSMIADLKMSIERKQTDMTTGDPRLQIVASLKLLHNASLLWAETGLAFENKLDLLRDLLLAYYRGGAQWTTEQHAHFRFMYDNLKNWKSYFISYGNSQSRRVNERYREVIAHYVGEPTLKTRDWNQQNILPDAIVMCLQHSNLLKYFYDRLHIQSGDALRSSINAAAAGAFSLLQLIQTDTFVKRSPNWPHEEYEIFEKSNAQTLALRAHYQAWMEKRFVALLTEDDVRLLRPRLLPFEYEIWAHRIFIEKRHEVLPTEPTAFLGLVRKVADAMIDLQLGLIEAVPA